MKGLEGLKGIENGSEITEEVMDIEEKTFPDIQDKISQAENIQNPSQKVLTFLELAKEARRQGDSQLSSLLNRKAIELEEENEKYFENDTQDRLQKVKDQIDVYKSNAESIKEPEKINYHKGNKPEIPVKLKKSVKERILNTLNSFFSF